MAFLSDKNKVEETAGQGTMPWSVLLRNSQNNISFFPFLELIKLWTAVDITAQQQSQMGRTFHFAMDPMIKGGQSCVLQIGIKSGSNGKFVTVSRQFSVGWWRLGDFWPVTYSYHPPNGWFQFFLWIHNNFTIEYFILKIYIMGRNTKISGFEKTKQSLADQKT